MISTEHLGEAKQRLKGLNNGFALSIIGTVGILFSAVLSAAKACRCASGPMAIAFLGITVIGLGVVAYNSYRLQELTDKVVRARATSWFGSFLR